MKRLFTLLIVRPTSIGTTQKFKVLNPDHQSIVKIETSLLRHLLFRKNVKLSESSFSNNH
jgi:hypothetical protein